MTAETKSSAGKLPELITAANLQYTLKNYVAAVELYSQATELQGQLNGEMAPENAELLYLYGRCLYRVAIAQSDVLGAKVVSEEKPAKKRKTDAGGAAPTDNGEGSSSSSKAVDGQTSATGTSAVTKKEGETVESKPYFQITGDENFTDSEDDEDAEDGDEGADEEGDDFGNAYEILDVARVLLTRQLAERESEADKDTSATAETAPSTDASKPSKQSLRTLKERLADVHDLQAEISLENERFLDAIPDARASLELNMQLHPPESNILAEAHYKLSLALEYASMRDFQEAQRAGGGQQQRPGKAPEVDMELRQEAATEMEAAIGCLRLQLKKHEAELASKSSDNEGGAADSADLEKTKASIKDAKEMMDDMRQRLHDLRADPLAANILEAAGITSSSTAAGAGPSSSSSTSNTGPVNDLTSLVKKKTTTTTNPPTVANGASTTSATSLQVPAASAGKKRKADDDDNDTTGGDDVDDAASSSSKKPRSEATSTTATA